MKIVPIFANRLYAFHYDGETDNEFERLMDLWTNVTYLRDFARQNRLEDIDGFIDRISDHAEQIQDYIENIHQNNEPYGCYFEPLQLSEQRKTLSLRKGKIPRNGLRLYAIKIEDSYVITGGAIKMSQKMDDHPDTQTELKKLDAARKYLQQNDILDADTFFELINE